MNNIRPLIECIERFAEIEGMISQENPSSEVATKIFTQFLDAQIHYNELSKDERVEITERFENTLRLVQERICPFISGQSVANIEKDFMSFINSESHMFGMDFACAFEVNETLYTSAEEYFSISHDEDPLLSSQRAKFNGSDALKKRLLETKDAYIFCQDSADNALGICLMRVRGELGGTGIVECSRALQIAEQCVQFKSKLVSPQFLPIDLCQQIFHRCSLSTFDQCSLVCNRWNEAAAQERPHFIFTPIDLRGLWGNQGITIFDVHSYPNAQKYGLEIVEQGFSLEQVNKIQAFARKCAPLMRPYFNGDNPGITCLTVPKGLTINHLLKIAQEAGMRVEDGLGPLTKCGDVAVKHTYTVLLTNGLLAETHNQSYKDHSKFVAERGLELMSIVELMALHILTYVHYKKYLYVPYSQNIESSRIYGRASKEICGVDLCVGIDYRYAVEGEPLFYIAQLYGTFNLAIGARKKLEQL